MTLALSILFILLTLYLLGGLYVFSRACSPRPTPNWDDPKTYANEVYSQFSDVIPLARKWFSQHNAQSIHIQSDDGLTLHGFWIPAENPKGTMILFHGYHSTYYVDFSAVYELYHDHGYNLLLVDQRCHGESQGKYITFGVKESQDLHRWIDYHNKAYGECPVFLCGLSMGASTVLFAAGDPLPVNVRGITADCGFSSPYEIICHVVVDTVGPLGKYLMPAARLWGMLLADFDMKSKNTVETLKKATVPILMCHGLADDFVPCQMSRDGYEACASEKELILVENAGHGVSFLADRPRLEKALLSFVERNRNKENKRNPQ